MAGGGMLGWLRRRRRIKAAAAALIAADAADLIARFGEAAYDIARARHRAGNQDRILDGNRAPGHWAKVKLHIARATHKEIGLDTSTRYLQDDG